METVAELQQTSNSPTSRRDFQGAAPRDSSRACWPAIGTIMSVRAPASSTAATRGGIYSALVSGGFPGRSGKHLRGLSLTGFGPKGGIATGRRSGLPSKVLFCSLETDDAEIAIRSSPPHRCTRNGGRGSCGPDQRNCAFQNINEDSTCRECSLYFA